MNKNLIALLLIIIAIGTYFTFTRGKLAELQEIKTVNAEYKKAIDDFDLLIKKRNAIIEQYNKLSVEDREKIEKLLPDNVDNVRLIIDVNSVAAKNRLTIKDVKTSADSDNGTINSGVVAESGGIQVVNVGPAYDTVTLSFKVESTYENFVKFLKDLEASLRIMDVSRITLDASSTNEEDSDEYSYDVEIKTYWLKNI